MSDDNVIRPPEWPDHPHWKRKRDRPKPRQSLRDQQAGMRAQLDLSPGAIRDGSLAMLVTLRDDPSVEPRDRICAGRALLDWSDGKASVDEEPMTADEWAEVEAWAARNKQGATG